MRRAVDSRYDAFADLSRARRSIAAASRSAIRPARRVRGEHVIDR